MNTPADRVFSYRTSSLSTTRTSTTASHQLSAVVSCTWQSTLSSMQTTTMLSSRCSSIWLTRQTTRDSWNAPAGKTTSSPDSITSTAAPGPMLLPRPRPVLQRSMTRVLREKFRTLAVLIVMLLLLILLPLLLPMEDQMVLQESPMPSPADRSKSSCRS